MVVLTYRNSISCEYPILVYVVLFVRNRISTIIIMYSLYCIFCRSQPAKYIESIEIFKEQKEVMLLWGIGFIDLIHIGSITNTRISAFIIDETIIKIGYRHFCLWIRIEPIDKSFLILIFLKKGKYL